MSEQMSTVQLLSGLKAAGESTRLRLLALLAGGELNVKDLTRILGQSQPRISRHLKLLTEAGLIERFREGSWVFFRLANAGGSGELARAIVNSLDTSDPDLERDRARAEAVMRDRAETAQAYFKEHASEWDVIRSLHVAEDEVEQAMLDAIGAGSFDYLVDLGTGTGRMLELFASRANHAVGIDINRDMLAYARAKLEAANLNHCQVRQGDLENHAHRRLGLEPGQVADWIASSGLKLAASRNLDPKSDEGADKLTVSLWLAEKSGKPAVRTRRSAGKLEATH